MNNKIPCENCIAFPRCLSSCRHSIMPKINPFRLRKRCSIIDKYFRIDLSEWTKPDNDIIRVLRYFNSHMSKGETK